MWLICTNRFTLENCSVLSKVILKLKIKPKIWNVFLEGTLYIYAPNNQMKIVEFFKAID